MGRNSQDAVRPHRQIQQLIPLSFVLGQKETDHLETVKTLALCEEELLEVFWVARDELAAMIGELPEHEDSFHLLLKLSLTL